MYKCESVRPARAIPFPWNIPQQRPLNSHHPDILTNDTKEGTKLGRSVISEKET